MTSPAKCLSLLFHLIHFFVAFHYARSEDAACHLQGGQCLPSDAYACSPLDAECKTGYICCEDTYPAAAYPETTYSETAYPETADPARQYSETAYPETAYPETAYSETAYPPAADPARQYSETAYPETAFSETAYPAAADPARQYSETAYPETAYTETAYPETAYPETAYSETAYPETAYPSTADPESTGTCQPLQEISSPSGIIAVGSEENYYENNLDCEWQLKMPPNTNIEIDVMSLDIEEGSPNLECPYDYLDIIDSTLNVSVSGGRLCGLELPPPIYVFSNKVTIQFHTDSSTTRPGFALSYSTINMKRDEEMSPLEPEMKVDDNQHGYNEE